MMLNPSLFNEAEFDRCHCGFGFKELEERRDGGEVEFVADFLYRQIRIFKQVFCFQNNERINPFRSPAPAYGFYKTGKILGREVELVGIESDVLMCHEIFRHQLEELLEKHVGPCGYSLVSQFRVRQFPRPEIVEQTEQGRADEAYRLFLSRKAGAAHIRHQGIIAFQNRLSLLVDGNARMFEDF